MMLQRQQLAAAHRSAADANATLEQQKQYVREAHELREGVAGIASKRIILNFTS